MCCESRGLICTTSSHFYLVPIVRIMIKYLALGKTCYCGTDYGKLIYGTRCGCKCACHFLIKWWVPFTSLRVFLRLKGERGRRKGRGRRQRGSEWICIFILWIGLICRCWFLWREVEYLFHYRILQMVLSLYTRENKARPYKCLSGIIHSFTESFTWSILGAVVNRHCDWSNRDT